MNDEELRAMFRTRLNAPPEVPLEATRTFLHIYVNDAGSIDEIDQHVRQMVAINPRTGLVGLMGIEALVREKHPPGTLINLLAYDGNWLLDENTDEHARQWLIELAQLVRQILGDLAPQREE